MENSNIYKGHHGIVGVLNVSQSKRYDDIGTGTVRYRTAHKSMYDSRVRSRTVQYLYRTGRQKFVILHTVQRRIVRK
jgi:hypothetical protein